MLGIFYQVEFIPHSFESIELFSLDFCDLFVDVEDGNCALSYIYVLRLFFNCNEQGAFTVSFSDKRLVIPEGS